MESEERPQKIRKLSHNDQTDTLANEEHQDKRDVEDLQRDADSGDLDLRGDRSTDDQHDATVGKRGPSINYQDPAYTGMSKNQVKKLLKKQEWESKREDRKAIRREKVVAKRERKRAMRAEKETGSSDPSSIMPGSAKPQKADFKKSVTLPITIVIDCNFDDLMRDNERISLAAQITRCYSDIKGSPFRAHLAISSFSGKLKERFQGPLAEMYKSWRGVRFLEDDFVQVSKAADAWMSVEGEKNINKFEGVFAPLNPDTAVASLDGERPTKPKALEELKSQGEVVYLSSESDETITELKPYSTYIVGGLVDKNREKGICHKRACQAGVKTARLPISEFMDMQSRKVLATNHVNEILIRWLETGDWGDAFFRVIPKRKGGMLKSKGDKDHSTEAEGENQENVDRGGEKDNQESNSESTADCMAIPKVQNPAVEV